MSQNHEVYVVYRDGQPISRSRVAYFSEGTAKAEITRRVKGAVGWHNENAKKVEAERRRYAVVPYIAKEVSE
ncbi:hypothetical protein [Paenibacillus apiarius]|uniref:hypothetical protein n=1 Tax=Paenibacillus apiarius TaxID=46240 RepID=UPI003B3A4201